MKSNPDKCHLLVSTINKVAIRIGNFQIESTKREKLLGIQLSRSCLSVIIYQKYAKKLYIIGRVTP